MSSNLKDITDRLEAFAEQLAVLHVTNNTSATLFATPVNVYRVEIDSPSGSLTSLLLCDGTTDSAYKGAYLLGEGTREISWMGRPKFFTSGVYVERHLGDTHLIDLTVVYRTE